MSEAQAVDAQAVAQLAGRTMLARDAASCALGMELVEIRPGYARMTMPVDARMINGHAICHGGYIFMLADSAFAFACNSYNHNPVGAGCSIEYLSPAREGELLCAEAVEQAVCGNTGVYDVKVSTQDGRVVALVRAKSHRIGGQVAELTNLQEAHGQGI